MCDFIGTPRVMYGDDACFLRVCPHCGRFVKADDVILISVAAGLKDQPNATCAVRGRVNMPFEGYI